MPSFDPVFNDLQLKVQAVIQMLIAEFPDAAVRASEIIAAAPEIAEIQATVQADEARANAISQLISGAGQMLAAVAPTPEPDPEEV